MIGVLSDSAPRFMAGIWTSQATAEPALRRARPADHDSSRCGRRRREATAKTLESTFLANGMQADSLRRLLDDAVGASLTFNRLIEASWGSD